MVQGQNPKSCHSDHFPKKALRSSRAGGFEMVEARAVKVDVLVDNSVRSWGVVARPISVPIPGTHNPLLLFETCKARNPTEAWLQNEIECLPTVARDLHTRPPPRLIALLRASPTLPTASRGEGNEKADRVNGFVCV